ncbi:hypothetical protein NVA20_13775 [Marinobacter sp. PJ-38]|nr:hypothetical protein [Marinobacter panjinensis]MCR8915822.1 hypothetical protein [Marinobacter panjinensis]
MGGHQVWTINTGTRELRKQASSETVGMHQLEITGSQQPTHLANKRKVPGTSPDNGDATFGKMRADVIAEPIIWRNQNKRTVVETGLAVDVPEEGANAPAGLESRHQNSHCRFHPGLS